MVTMIMMIAPVGVFALIAQVIVSEGLDVFVPLLKYMGTVLGALGLHALVVYPLLLVLLARHQENPLPGDRYVAVLTGRK